MKIKDAINYLYGGMYLVPHHISNSKLSEKDCQVIHVTVVEMEQVVGIILKNQSSG